MKTNKMTFVRVSQNRHMNLHMLFSGRKEVHIKILKEPPKKLKKELIN